MVYRSEIKHFITPADRVTIVNRLRMIAALDPHAEKNGGVYHIRSLYFDNVYDRALRDKVDGLNEREKFRIRLYQDTGYITLEKKVKRGGLGYKLDQPLTEEEARKIVNGDVDWMVTSGKPLLIELYSRMKSQVLRPRTIVDYTRIPFVYKPGNVRVTIDYNIRTGLRYTDFLNPDCVTIPAGDSVMLLEVKWDDYLPSVIRNAVQLKGHNATAFSKYQACRLYD